MTFINALNAAKSDETGDISFNTVSLVNGFEKDRDNNGALVVSVNYQLAEDASAFKAVASARYENEDIPYVTPYVFEDKTPKSEMSGPLYRNTFTFNSKQYPVPPLTDELKADLVAAVKDQFRLEDGTLPVEGKALKKMERGIEKANDDKLKKSEISIFLVQEWVNDGATPLQMELEDAHKFFAKYILADLNSTEVPSLNGTDRILETLDNGRVVKIVGQGLNTGSYVSQPGNVQSYTTYGNAINYSTVGKSAAKDAKAAAKSR